MKLEYYIFALFVFGLICIVMFIARILFGSAKKRSVLLDEKEANLLKLYRDVEELVDDLYVRMQENAEEFSRLESLRVVREKQAELAEKETEQPQRVSHAPPAAQTEAATAPRRAVKVNGEKSADNKKDENTPPHISASMRRQEILRMIGEGKTDRQVADELEITLSEVRLVKGLYKPVGG